ncbi:hypothetical protein SCHPADRAFT_885330 [Schizopora paradoxa]|uniref:SEC7 domain-containing protein n=1 Tax=Schizopora paradoxa TaxID=27342 RepID=A0A0H2S5D0_9AGAM|nr:hypothetical protein SCHPADRAFT_885330 [Schizopora paradoxa]
MDTDAAAVAEQRANAVAKLRRAASLPRMKDGRRPPMHGEAGGVSEGEPGQEEGKKDGDEQPTEATPEDGEGNGYASGEGEGEQASSKDELSSAAATDSTVGQTNAPAKRRSRSRSRSRGSKDLRLKMKAAASLADQEDEQPQGMHPAPSPSAAAQPYFMQLQMGLGQPMLSPLSPFGFGGSPVAGVTPTGLPSLQALQTRHLQGLFRSNSAAARLMAMRKLTGETGAPENAGVAQTDMNQVLGGPGGSMLARNNTVAGEERVAARQQLLKRLGGRRGGADGEITSGEEGAPSTSAPSKSRRRRSRRKSTTSVLVDDREGLSASASSIAISPSFTPAPEELLINVNFDQSPSSTLPQILPIRTPSIPLEMQRKRLATPDRNVQTPDLLTFTPQLRTFTPDLRSQTPLRRTPEPEPPRVQEEPHYPFDASLTRRGVVVEEEDEMPMHLTPPRSARSTANALPPSASQTPVQQHLSFLPPSAPFARHHHTSDAPSMMSTSTDSGGANGLNVPLFMPDPEQRSPFRQDIFPKSPFGTPIRENMRTRDDDEEHVLYPDSSGSHFADREASWIDSMVQEDPPRMEEDREISWVAELVPEVRLAAPEQRDVTSWIDSEPVARIPVYDDDEEEEEVKDDAEEPLSPVDDHPQTSPRDSSQSQELIVEVETSPDVTPSYATASEHQLSQHSTTSTATMNTNVRVSNFSSISGTSINRADTPSRSMDRTHSQADSLRNWDDRPQSGVPEAPGLSSKRSADSTNTSAWSKVKSTFARSGSSLGRRSRSNSIAKKDNTESSRESAASLNSGKRESRGEGSGSAVSGSFAWQQQTPQHQQPVIQTTASSISPAGSVSMLALSAPPPRSGVSPIPPPSDSDAAKYINPKLFPFPGMVKLQEERSRGMSVSSPDIVLSQSTMNGEKVPVSANSSASSQFNDVRERRISHQASDSQLLAKFQGISPQMKLNPSVSSQTDYFSIPKAPQVQPSTSSGLPFTREGVKKWLSARVFSSKSPSAVSEPRAPDTSKKPSLSDLIQSGRGEISDWEDVDNSSKKSRAPTLNSNSTVRGRPIMRNDDIQESSPDDPVMAYNIAQPTPRSPRVMPSLEGDLVESRESRHTSVPLSSRDPVSSTTPDPLSSADDDGSVDGSSAVSRSSMASLYSAALMNRESTRVADILERLDHVLQADELNRIWGSALKAPPRKLMLSYPMLQVADCDTVKDRFLFLFSDMLIIAKPMLPDRNSLLDSARPYPPDRKFLVKNVVHLKDIRLNVDREEDPTRITSALVSQRPDFILRFIEEFMVDPDIAVSRIIDLQTPKGYIALGRLLVQLPELNRSKLGEYLGRRSSRPALKAYIDAFGFTGMDIDVALRIFLLSLHIPSGPSHANTLETFLDTFAGRWYEANAGIVTYHRDLAMRLVRAIVRLNEALHSAIAQENGASGYSRHFINSRDFTDAFRRHDPRGLVPDNVLEKIYASVRQEKLCQARNPTNGRAPQPISFKRAIPSCITYRRQSEPVIIKIPQADPHLSIQLHGQDLTFDPPVLSFAKSAEASFRITGTGLGHKTMVIGCSGSNAPNYSGLPLSTTVAVERAFMRNTFQVAFLDNVGRKRKYMFSVDDPVIRHEWTSSLRRQMDSAIASQSPDLPPPMSIQVYQAAESVSFKALQETLLANDAETPNGVQSRTSPAGATNGFHKHNSSVPRISPSKDIYKRSQSRSQMYRYGEGRNEQELSNGLGEAHEEDHPMNGLDLLEDIQGQDARLWTSSELELLCQQNSSISLVLSLLQAAQPYDVEDEYNTGFHFPPSTPSQRFS